MKARSGRSAAWRLRCSFLLICAVLAPGAAGCSDGDGKRTIPADPLQAALSYLPAESAAVFVVATDPERGPVAGLDRLGSSQRSWQALKRQIESSVGLAGIDFDRLRPQLGNPFTLGITEDGSRVGAIRVQDAAALRKDVEQRIGEGNAQRLEEVGGDLAWREKGLQSQALGYSALNGNELILAQSERGLDEAIAAAEKGENVLSDDTLMSALARLDPGSLVRLVGDSQRLLSTGDPLRAADARKIPWVRALGTFAGAFTVGRRVVTLDLRIRTDRVPLATDQLPLVPGARRPLLHDRSTAGAVGIHRPAQLFRFLESSLQATDPGTFARLKAGEDQLRAILGVDVHRDLLEKIGNLSLAGQPGRTITFVGLLSPGSEADFKRALDRAELFIEGIAGELLGTTGNVEARGAGEGRVWVVRNRGVTIARYAVRDGALIGTIGRGQLPPAVRGSRLRGVSGALAVKGNPDPVAPFIRLLPGVPRELVDVIPRLPNVSVGVRTETDAMTVEARVPVGK